MKNKLPIKLGDKVIVYGNRNEIAQVVDDHGSDEFSCQYLNAQGLPAGQSFRVDVEEMEFYDPEFEEQRRVKLQAHIDDATNAFEKAFEALGKLMKETGGDYIPTEDSLDLSKLEEVIEKAGWSSSSLYC